MQDSTLGMIIIGLDIRQERIGSDFRIPVLAVAVGIYLPISLSTPIFIGGMLAHFGDKMGATETTRKKGLLLAKSAKFNSILGSLINCSWKLFLVVAVATCVIIFVADGCLVAPTFCLLLAIVGTSLLLNA